MSLFNKLRAKSWETPGYDENEPADVLILPEKKIGLWVFLAVVCSVFALFTVAYNMRIQLATDWQVLPKPKILWLNTALLVLASVAFERAKIAANQMRLLEIRIALTAGGILTIAFLVGQLAAWDELQQAGYYLAGNPSHAFFYLLTGLHAAHMLGGLWVWARTTYRVWRGFEVTLSVELCTTYWHCLLLIWIVLYGLLLST